MLDQLGAEDWPDFEATFDANIGKYCLECIQDRAPEFGELYERPSDDRSWNRFTACRYLVTAFPEMTVTEYATFCEAWEGSGEPDHRQLAREFTKAKRNPITIHSNGAAFGAVVDEDDESEVVQRQQSRSCVRDSYLVANYTPLRWLVKRLIPLNSVGALYGLPNVGKSFVVFDLASHARRERDWFGRKVRGGDVLYLYAEGAEGIAGRAKAWADMQAVEMSR